LSLTIRGNTFVFESIAYFILVVAEAMLGVQRNISLYISYFSYVHWKKLVSLPTQTSIPCTEHKLVLTFTSLLFTQSPLSTFHMNFLPNHHRETATSE